MIKCTVVLFSRDTNGKRFSKKCLKKIARDNKGMVAKVADGEGLVHDIRYHRGQVLATFTLPLYDVSCSGTVLKEVKNKVTDFKVHKIELIELETKEVNDGNN